MNQKVNRTIRVEKNSLELLEILGLDVSEICRGAIDKAIRTGLPPDNRITKEQEQSVVQYCIRFLSRKLK